MRRRIAYLLPVAAIALLGLALVATADDGDQGRGKHPKVAARAVLKSADESGERVVARVRLIERRNGKVAVVVRARGLTPGFHGFHVHEAGECAAPFTSAGGHHKQTGQDHGAHAGDMPPLLVTKDGKARAAFVTDSFTVGELLAGDGSAIMIHEGSDNLANIPSRYTSAGVAGPDAVTRNTGDAGPRFACGVVQRRPRQ